jgi:NO-binding membrane sensor protein with MHYT domain
MSIDWSGLLRALAVSVGAGVGLVGLFALGVRGLALRARSRRQGGRGYLGMAVAAVCFTACAAAVLYGLYLYVVP